MILSEWQPVFVARDKKLLCMQREVPHASAGQVQIQVMASGVNRPDLLQASGDYPPPIGHSDIVGLEVAGVTETGERVCALLEGGGYARYAIADAGLCLPMPNTLSWAEAACLPEALFTLAAAGLCEMDLRGKAVLIQGASGGLGHIAVQLCKKMGAFVVAVCYSSKQDFCLKMGADRVLPYDTTDLLSLREHSPYSRMNVIIDIVGGTLAHKHLQLLAVDGVLLQLALQQQRMATVDMMPLLLKRLTWCGSVLRARTLTEKRHYRDLILTHWWRWVMAGEIRPHVDTQFPLMQAEQAHAYLQTGKVCGKLVLV